MSDQLIERIVRHEWDQFQRTNNEGGRAACQGNWPVFRQMRTSQFMTWTDPLLDSYLADLVEGFGGAPLMDVIRVANSVTAPSGEAVAGEAMAKDLNA